MKIIALLGLLLSSCYALTGNGTMGECQMPPPKSEGYTLVACSVEPEAWDNLVCYYAKETATNIQIRAVASRGCGGFELVTQTAIPKQ